MPDPTTVNRGLFVPVRGSDVGTWDVPVNANENLLDTMLGGITNVSVTNVNVTLTPTQYANGTIVVTGALTGGVQIIFPSVQGWWTVYNKTTNSSGTLGLYASVAGGAQLIGLPPGEQTLIQVNGASGVNYVGLGRVGSYLDLARSTVPAWISSSTVPPYLNCDGSTFSGVTYPFLADFLGGTTLPDSKGRFRASLNQGSGRITTASGGVDGNTIFSGGGVDAVNLPRNSLPNVSPIFSGTPIPSLSVTTDYTIMVSVGTGLSPQSGGANWTQLSTGQRVGTVEPFTPAGLIQSLNGAVTQVPLPRMAPTYIGGLTLIRAA